MSIVRFANQWLHGIPDNELPEAAETRSLQMASFARHTPINSFVSMSLSFFAVVSLWHGGERGFILPWAGLIWVLGLWHLFKWWRRHDLPSPRRVSGRGVRKAAVWTLLGGLLWGSTVFIYAEVSDTQRLLLMIMGMGVAAGAATTLGAVPVAAASFITAAVVPWIGLFLVQLDLDYFALACMALVFMLAMLSSTRVVYAAFIESVKARQANTALLAQFHSERDEWFEISDTAEAFALFDDQDCLLLWNENYRRILSLPAEALRRGAVRRELLQLCAAPVEVMEDRLTREQWIERHLRLQDEANLSQIEELSNGRWLKSSARRTSLDHTVTLHVDVTALKSQESALMESEARLKAFLDHAPVELGIKDLDGRYIFVSKEFERVQGINAQEVVGRRAEEIYDRQVAGELKAHDEAVISSGQTSRREISVPGDDGVNTFLTVKFPIKDTSGRVTGIGAVSTDITELKVKDRALRESEVRFKAFLEHSPVDIGLKDLEGRYLVVSRNFEEQIGVAPGKAQGKTAFDFLSRDIAEKVEAHDLQVIEAGHVVESEIYATLADGPHTYLAVKFPVPDASGKITAIGGVATDITERKRVEQELEASRALLADAVEALADGFVIADADERLVLCNSRYREIYSEFAEHLVPGVSMEEVARLTAKRCLGIIGDEDIETWVRGRMERRRNPTGYFEMHLKSGRWIRIRDDRLPNGWTVGIRTDITELKERQRALEESEQRFRAIADDTPIMLWVCDAENKPTFYNRALLEFHGLKPDEALAWDYLKAIHPADRALIDDLEREWQKRPRPQTVVYRLCCADGSYRWVLDVTIPRYASDGTYLGGIGTYVDINDQKQAQEALRESEKRFQDFAESSADWFWEMDAELRFTYLSPNVERMVGVPPEWHYGKSREDILGEYDNRDLWDSHLRSLKAHEAFRDFVYPRVGEGIEPRWLRTSGVPVFADDGDFLGYRGSGSDVTAEVEAEQALKASEEQLRLVTDSLPVLIAHCDRDGNYLFVNETCVEWFGMPRDGIIGQSVESLFPDIYEKIRPRIETALRGDRVSFDMTASHGDGRTRDVQVLYVPRLDEAGGTESYFVLVEDVSERKRAEETLRERETRLHDLQRQLEQVSRVSAMGHLSSALAHELNQPLTAIMNYAQAARRLLNASGDSPPKVEEMIDKATTQAGRAGDVIRRLRGLFERGETEISLESINGVIEEAASLALLDAESREISYKLKLKQDLPPVMIDKIQIQQVVLNLVRNAVDALDGMSERQLVIETSQPTGGSVEVAVCDSGPGLPAEIEKQMFEPFVTGKHGSMGVGLSISNRIIEAHGGRLWAESNAGGGTCFRFTLPSKKPAGRKDDG